MEKINAMTSDSILNDSVFEEVFSQEDEIYRARLLLTLIDRAKELGVKKKFEDMVKAYEKAEKRIAKKEKEEAKLRIANQVPAMQTTCFDYFEDGHEYDCGHWIANDQGIVEQTPIGFNRACYHPILPVQILRNAETGKEKVEIAFCKAGKWEATIVDKTVLASANKIVGLSAYGVSVTSENARYLVRFLNDIENLNTAKITRKTSTSKLGWIGAEFLPYGYDIEFDSKERFKDIFESVAEVGNRQKWMDCVKGIRSSGRREPLVYLAASFGSILLKPLNILPSIVNLWSETGKGKTVALMVAASIWANPADGKYMTDPSSTVTALEIRLNILNSLPLMIDDLSKMKNSNGDEFTDTIYMLCGGKGKDRSNVDLGLNCNATWQNMILTNIERPLATDTMRGGAINRILDFEMDEGTVFPDGNAVVKCVTKNYGFAGKEWVEIVKQVGFEEIESIRQQYVEKIKTYCAENGMDKEEKQIIPLSVLLVADELTEKHIFQDGVRLDFAWCVQQLKDTTNVSDNERAYGSIMDEITVHEANFASDPVSGSYRADRWGGIKDGYVYIVPSIFEEMAKRNNFSTASFIKWAVRRELAMVDRHSKQPTRLTKKARVPNNSEPRNYYCIKIQSDASDEGFVEVDEETDLPFL